MKHNDFLTSLKSLKSQMLAKERHKQPHYHTSSKELFKQSRCNCTDANGIPKYLYSSTQEIAYMLSAKDISLKSYPCPYEKGWHLTKG